MDSQRDFIFRALRSPRVWITGSMLGVILLAAAASCSNLSHYGHHNHGFNRKSMVDLEVLKMTNDFGLMIDSCYCKCHWYWYCYCQVECDRVLPEGSFSVTKQLEETTSNESSVSEKDEDQNMQIAPTLDEQKEMDLKLLVEYQNNTIVDLEHMLHMKENEVWKLRKQRKAEVRLKKQLLDDATELIRKQEGKLIELQSELGEKARLEGKMKNIEANLEKQTIRHLSAQEELMALAGKVILTEKNVSELHQQNLQAMSELESQASDVRELIIQLREEVVQRNRAKWANRLVVSMTNDKDSSVRMEIELETARESPGKREMELPREV